MCKSNTFFSFTNYFYEKNLLAQEFVLKQKQIDDGDGDIGIGQVEDGSEKVVVAVHQEVQEPRYTVNNTRAAAVKTDQRPAQR